MNQPPTLHQIATNLAISANELASNAVDLEYMAGFNTNLHRIATELNLGAIMLRQFAQHVEAATEIEEK